LDDTFWPWLKEVQLSRLIQGGLMGGMTCDEYMYHTFLEVKSKSSESPVMRVSPPGIDLHSNNESGILDYDGVE
jgi:hypothetical protein